MAVSGRRRLAAGAHDGPPQLDQLEVEVYFAGYADKLAAAGALPVHVPAGADPGAVAARVDALVLTGGTDVDPALYGEEPHPSVRVDRARDDRELALLAAALERGLPVLAICRGLQLLNVHLGGTLHQHLAAHPVGGDGVHEVRFAADNTLRGVYGPRRRQQPAPPGRRRAGQAWRASGTPRTASWRRWSCTAAGRWGAVASRTADRPDPVFAWLVSATSSRETG